LNDVPRATTVVRREGELGLLLMGASGWPSNGETRVRRVVTLPSGAETALKRR
jgi:hypothetical protein